MEIKRTNIENLAKDKKTIYRLTKGTRTSFKDLEDEDLDKSWPVDAFLIYEDTTSTGATNTLISILSNGQIIGGQSKPFIESFEEIVDIMEDEPISIHINRYQSRNNRTYYTATLDC